MECWAFKAKRERFNVRLGRDIGTDSHSENNSKAMKQTGLDRIDT